jgi:hypothetical protein
MDVKEPVECLKAPIALTPNRTCRPTRRIMHATIPISCSYLPERLPHSPAQSSSDPHRVGL